MNERENWLRAWRFQGPDHIPIAVSVPPAMWRFYGRDLEDIVARHPLLFPHFRKGSIDYDRLPIDPRNKAGTVFVDPWGCVYKPAEDDVPSYVAEHPLESWDKFDAFQPPDPSRTNGRLPIDWEQIEETIRRRKRNAALTSGSLIHGHLFLLLENLRGYENLMFDMIDREPRLRKLIAMIEDFSMYFVRRYVALGVDVMRYPEDLGAQDRPMLSPAHFREYIAPVYARLMAPAKQAGVLVHMHCDGYLWDLMDDILACGVDIINLQDLVNGVDEIRRRLKGRVCIDLDIDRQRVTRFGSPHDVDDLVREAVEKLGAPEGGLTLRHGLYSGAPLENVDALMTAMEKYAFRFS